MRERRYWTGRCPIHDCPWWVCDLHAGWPLLVVVLMVALFVVFLR